MPIDTGTADHDIVDDRKAALATNPVSLTVLQTAIGQYSRFVQRDTAAILCLGKM